MSAGTCTSASSAGAAAAAPAREAATGTYVSAPLALSWNHSPSEIAAFSPYKKKRLPTLILPSLESQPSSALDGQLTANHV